MTNGKDRRNEPIENLLRKVRLPEPSIELKERITAEATRVWKQTSVELSWRIPFRRLVVSAAAAVLVIWLANVSSDYSVARWRYEALSKTNQQPSALDILPEMPYGSFARHLASVARELPATEASGLHQYVETMQELLNEVQQNNVSQPPAPTGGSRLLPEESRSNSYS